MSHEQNVETKKKNQTQMSIYLTDFIYIKSKIDKSNLKLAMMEVPN